MVGASFDVEACGDTTVVLLGWKLLSETYSGL